MSFLFRFPFCELSLSFFAMIVCHDVGKESASDAFDGMLRNVGVVDELFLDCVKRSSQKGVL